jgi:hypothetical protein
MIYRHLLNFSLLKSPTLEGWGLGLQRVYPFVAPLDEIQWLSAPFLSGRENYASLRFDIARSFFCPYDD